MKTVGLKAFKNNLSRYVREAAAGETIVITDRDRPVAELRAPDDDANREKYAGESAFLQDLARRGLVQLPKNKTGLPPPVAGTRTMTLEEILEDLEFSRSDRF